MAKKILLFVGFWGIMNLTLMVTCSEQTLKDYAGGLNLITIPMAILLTYTYCKFTEKVQNHEELIMNDNEEQSEIESDSTDDIVNIIDEADDDIIDVSLEDVESVRNMFIKSYHKSLNLWESRLKAIDQFNLKYPWEYQLAHEKEYELAEKNHVIILQENETKLDKLRFDINDKIPQNTLSIYQKYLGSIEDKYYGNMYMVKSVKNPNSNITGMELDHIAPHISHARIGFNNVWVDNLFEITLDDNYFFFYPDYVISCRKSLFSEDFNILSIEEVTIKYIEHEFTERIERLSDGYEIGRYIYADNQQKAPSIMDKGVECPKKVYGFLRISPLGIVLFFKNPSEGREVADALEGYISEYRRAQSIESDESYNPFEDLIGLKRVKEEITTLTNFIKMKQKRDEVNLKSPTISYHCVFSGNPGTGKTTVARIIAEIYRNMGVLKKGHLVETDRSGLVAEYVGQTAIKTNKIIDSALDGVLFIDEAYTLAQGGNEDYGREAIATLLKRMEDDRDRLVVILAGYTNEIEQFIDSNPGLRSRFNRYIHFDDYTAEELYEIFCLQVKKSEYVLAEDASQYLKERLAAVVADKPKDFGNARYVRNLFEKTIEAQSNRLASKAELSKDDLTLITKKDLQLEDPGLSAKTEQHTFRIKKRPIEQKKDIYIDKVEKKTMTGNKPSDLNLLGNISSVDNSFEIHDDCDETIEVSYSVIGYDDFSDNTFEMNIKERDYNWLTDKEDDGEYLDSDFVSENRHGLHKRILWAIHKNMEDESEIDLPELIDDDDIEYTLSCI